MCIKMIDIPFTFQGNISKIRLIRINDEFTKEASRLLTLFVEISLSDMSSFYLFEKCN